MKSPRVAGFATVLLLLLTQTLIPVPAAAAPIEIARWGTGALTDGGVAYTPDGRLVAVATTIGVRLHDPVTRRLLRTLVTPAAVASLAFAPGGRTLAVGLEDSSVELWRVADGQLLRRLRGLPYFVRRVIFTPDGQIVVGLTGEEARLWQVADGRSVPLPGGDSPGLNDLAFAPDGRTFAVAIDCALELRRWADGAVLRPLTSPDHGCQAPIAFAPDGQTVAAPVYSGVGLWRVSDGALLHIFLQGGPEEVRSLLFAPDGQTLVVAFNVGFRDPGFDYATYLALWRVADGTLLHTREGDWLHGPAFAPNGRTLLVSSQDAQVHTWQVVDGKEAPILTALPSPLLRFALAPDGRTLAISQGRGGVQIRRIADGRVLRTLGRTLPPEGALAFAPGGGTLAVANGREVRLWRVADGRLLWLRRPAVDQVDNLVFTPDGRYLVVAGHLADAQGSPAQVWRATDGALVHTLGTAPVNTLAMAAHGQVLAVDSVAGVAENTRRTVWLWRITDWSLLHVLTDTGGFTDMALAADGRRLAGADPEHGVQLWRAPDGAPLGRPVEGQDTLGLSGPIAVAFAPDGRTLAVGDADRSLTIRRVADGQVLANLPGHAASLAQLGFSPDGRLLVSTAWDGTLRIWRIR